MGGIRKSTLAEAAMRRLSSAFESSFFVNVSEEVKKHDPSHLKNEIFKGLLKDVNVDAGISFSDARLRRTKACLVLDNVDDQVQLKCLDKYHVPFGGHQQIKSRFGCGSLIILTSRDKKLLLEMADYVYEVKKLDMNEAARLFSHNAFRGEHSISKESDYTELSKRVVAYCGGNPLALNVLGCYLHSRSVREWESALIGIKKIPNEKIQGVLKISYDALNPVNQSIFLDIACFFKGEKRQLIEDTVGDEACVGITVLIEKCLVSIDENSRLQMHDLIQEMGRELGKQSRLWDDKDVCSVLKRPKGSAGIEGISLFLSNMSQNLHFKPTVFEPLENLRILKIYSYFYGINKSIVLHQGLQSFPDSLQYLKWMYYPLKFLPMDFYPHNLVSLQMQHSKLEKLWNGVVHLGNLKHIDLQDSRLLVELPDISTASKLQTVNLDFGFSLRQFPKISNSTNCFKMTYSEIEEFDPSLESLENITVLNLSNINFKTMPHFKHMCKLKWLTLIDSKSLEYLEDLPSSLRLLNVGCCDSLKTIDIRACALLNGVDADRCTSLTHLYVNESVSASKRLHIPCSKMFPGVDEAEYNYLWNHFTFNQCDKLKPSVQQSIWTLLKRLQLSLTYTLRNDLLLTPESFFKRPPWGHAWYPGDEIPKQFNQQSEGSKIIVRHPHSDPIIGCEGFFLSGLLAFEGVFYAHRFVVTVSSTCDNRETSLESPEVFDSADSAWCIFQNYRNKGHTENHVVMWFIPFRVPPKVLLEFKIKSLNDDYSVYSGHCKIHIRRCGICTVPLSSENKTESGSEEEEEEGNNESEKA